MFAMSFYQLATQKKSASTRLADLLTSVLFSAFSRPARTQIRGALWWVIWHEKRGFENECNVINKLGQFTGAKKASERGLKRAKMGADSPGNRREVIGAEVPAPDSILVTHHS